MVQAEMLSELQWMPGMIKTGQCHPYGGKSWRFPELILQKRGTRAADTPKELGIRRKDALPTLAEARSMTWGGLAETGI
jgi:hypothetical protein